MKLKLILILTILFLSSSKLIGQNILVINSDTVATFSSSSVKTINKIFTEHNILKIKLKNIESYKENQKKIIKVLTDKNDELTIITSNLNKMNRNLLKTDVIKTKENELIIKKYKKQLFYTQALAVGLVIVIIILI